MDRKTILYIVIAFAVIITIFATYRILFPLPETIMTPLEPVYLNTPKTEV